MVSSAFDPRKATEGAPASSTSPHLDLPAYPHVPTALLLFFCGYVVVWYLQFTYRFPPLGAIRFELIYGSILGLIAVLRGASLTSPLTGLLVALFLCMAIEVPLSYDATLSFNVFVDRVLKFFCMAIFIVAFVKGPRQLKWFLGAFLFAVLKMGQEGFLGQITGSLLWQNQGVMRLHGATPNYESPNSFSGMALGALPFVFYLFPVCSRRFKVVMIVLAVFCLNIILFTGSRTGYVGFLGFILFLLYKAKRRSQAVFVVVALAAATLPFVPADYLERFDSIYTGVDKEGESTRLRREILRDAWTIFLSHPLGVGVSAFPVVRSQTFGRNQDTHNLYLEVATNLGVQGLVVFLLFVVGLLLLLSRLVTEFDRQLHLVDTTGPPGHESAARRNAHSADLRLMRQTALAVQGFVIVRLTLGLFGMDLYEIYWWFAMGLAIALYKMELVARARTKGLVSSVEPDAPAPALSMSWRLVPEPAGK